MTTSHQHIDVNSYSAWFVVQTVHGCKLEFVLSAADDRRGDSRNHAHVTTTYTGELYVMLTTEFKDENTRVTETNEYGDIMFRIEADTIPEIQEALDRCDQITKKWINKFNINRMKGE